MPPRRPPGRPRDERADARILRATVELIAEQGLPGMTMDAVAERAGVAKTTIYRRWDAKEALVVDAIRALARPVQAPDIGSLRGDLVAVLDQLVAVLRDSPAGRVAPAIIGEMPRNASLAAAFRDSFIAERRAVVEVIVDRARQRGEVTSEGAAAILPELVVGPLMARILVSGDPVDRPFLTALVDALLRAVGAAS